MWLAGCASDGPTGDARARNPPAEYDSTPTYVGRPAGVYKKNDEIPKYPNTQIPKYPKKFEILNPKPKSSFAYFAGKKK